MDKSNNPVRDLWVPMLRPEDRGSPRARASQILEMILEYGLIEDAWCEGNKKFIVIDHERRLLSAEEVLDEYGEKVARMVDRVIEHSSRTTTLVPVPVGRAEGPVPYIPDVGDRLTEYRRYWCHG